MTENMYILLLAHLLGFPRLYKEAVTSSEKDQLFPEHESGACAELWELVVGYAGMSGMDTPPAPSILRADGLSPEASEVLDLILSINSRELSEDTGKALVGQAITRVVKASLARRMAAARTVKEIGAALDDGKTTLAGVAGEVSKGSIINPLDMVEALTEQSMYISTHVDFFDDLLDGGFQPGELIIMMGPTGGGKTLTACQLSMAQARNNSHILQLSYEQGFKGDIMSRFGSLLTGCDVNLIRGRRFEDWPMGVKATYKELSPMYSRYLHCVDMTAEESNAGGGAATIKAYIQELIDKDCKPSLVTIDWLMPLLTQVCQVKLNGALDNEKLRIYGQIVAREIGAIAKETQVPILVLHQLNADMARASASKKAKITDAQEVRTICNLADIGLVLCNRDKKTNVAQFLVDKNRRGEMRECFIRMDGAHCVFRRADDVMISRSGTIVQKSSDGFNPEMDGEF